MPSRLRQPWHAYAIELEGTGSVDDVIRAVHGLIKGALLQQIAVENSKAVARVGLLRDFLEVLNLALVRRVADSCADTADNGQTNNKK
jgi:hypothetical protein